jgi:hypothetical protein
MFNFLLLTKPTEKNSFVNPFKKLSRLTKEFDTAISTSAF